MADNSTFDLRALAEAGRARRAKEEKERQEAEARLYSQRMQDAAIELEDLFKKIADGSIDHGVLENIRAIARDELQNSPAEDATSNEESSSEEAEENVEPEEVLLDEASVVAAVRQIQNRGGFSNTACSAIENYLGIKHRTRLDEQRIAGLELQLRKVVQYLGIKEAPGELPSSIADKIIEAIEALPGKETAGSREEGVDKRALQTNVEHARRSLADAHSSTESLEEVLKQPQSITRAQTVKSKLEEALEEVKKVQNSLS